MIFIINEDIATAITIEVYGSKKIRVYNIVFVP
jgi:hypothetical protein